MDDELRESIKRGKLRFNQENPNDTPESRNRTRLMWMLGDYEATPELIEKALSLPGILKSLNTIDEDGNTALILAAQHPTAGIFEEILKHNPILTTMDNRGRTALQYYQENNAINQRIKNPTIENLQAQLAQIKGQQKLAREISDQGGLPEDAKEKIVDYIGGRRKSRRRKTKRRYTKRR